MLELSEKSQNILNKVEMELKSGAFELGDHAQLLAFCYEKPNITYLGLLEKAEKYLPTNMNIKEEEVDDVLDVYAAYKNLVERKVSPVAVSLYLQTCLKIRLKEMEDNFRKLESIRGLDARISEVEVSRFTDFVYFSYEV